VELTDTKLKVQPDATILSANQEILRLYTESEGLLPSSQDTAPVP
jgi:hypothetical protein